MRLVQNIRKQAKITGVCMARFMLSNGSILSHFDNTHLKLSANTYFVVRFLAMLSKYENSSTRIL